MSLVVGACMNGKYYVSYSQPRSQVRCNITGLAVILSLGEAKIDLRGHAVCVSMCEGWCLYNIMSFLTGEAAAPLPHHACARPMINSTHVLPGSHHF